MLKSAHKKNATKDGARQQGESWYLDRAHTPGTLGQEQSQPNPTQPDRPQEELKKMSKKIGGEEGWGHRGRRSGGPGCRWASLSHRTVAPPRPPNPGTGGKGG